MKEAMTAGEIKRSLARIAYEILEKNDGVQDLALIGIRTRGIYLADRLATTIERLEGKKPLQGTIDITLYRDDFKEIIAIPTAQGTDIMFDLNGVNVVLVDDVLYTGRTVRAAIDVIIDFGRPRTIQLAVLVDRGLREFPIHADYIGKELFTQTNQFVEVLVKEKDGADKVLILEKGEAVK
ncbi:bifunctional pyr operon transcriptional regulator/uracil phosphoribosyltransferase PyrR [bacterium]|nr:bifunctional pyr operon transcriptional regulator/uracil phosphoribosyltransferase PyrR [bacterium]